MRIYMAVMAVSGWFALVLQFPLALASAHVRGISLAGAVTNYFSFFTILTNILVALGLSCSLWTPGSTLGRYFGRPGVRTGLALYIGVVGAVYALVLRELWSPAGLQKVADVLLHELLPVLYVLYWVLFVSTTRLAWKSVLWWLIYPAVYLVYTLLHGEFSGWYPYPFVDVGAIGFGRVLLNSAGLLVVFLMAGIGLVGITRWRGNAGKSR